MNLGESVDRDLGVAEEIDLFYPDAIDLGVFFAKTPLYLRQQLVFFEKRVQKNRPCDNVLADGKTWQQKKPRNAI